MTCRLEVTEITYQIRCRLAHGLGCIYIHRCLSAAIKKYLGTGTADSVGRTKDVIQAMRLSVVRATYNEDQPGLFFMLGTGNIDSVALQLL